MVENDPGLIVLVLTVEHSIARVFEAQHMIVQIGAFSAQLLATEHYRTLLSLITQVPSACTLHHGGSQAALRCSRYAESAAAALSLGPPADKDSAALHVHRCW